MRQNHEYKKKHERNSERNSSPGETATARERNKINTR